MSDDEQANKRFKETGQSKIIAILEQNIERLQEKLREAQSQAEPSNAFETIESIGNQENSSITDVSVVLNEEEELDIDSIADKMLNGPPRKLKRPLLYNSVLARFASVNSDIDDEDYVLIEMDPEFQQEMCEVQEKGQQFVKEELNEFKTEAEKGNSLTLFFTKFTRFVRNGLRNLFRQIPFAVNMMYIIAKNDPIKYYIQGAFLCANTLGISITWIDKRLPFISMKRKRTSTVAVTKHDSLI